MRQARADAADVRSPLPPLSSREPCGCGGEPPRRWASPAGGLRCSTSTRRASTSRARRPRCGRARRRVDVRLTADALTALLSAAAPPRDDTFLCTPHTQASQPLAPSAAPRANSSLTVRAASRRGRARRAGSSRRSWRRWVWTRPWCCTRNGPRSRWVLPWARGAGTLQADLRPAGAQAHLHANPSPRSRAACTRAGRPGAAASARDRRRAAAVCAAAGRAHLGAGC
jgi:hypothetical protein